MYYLNLVWLYFCARFARSNFSKIILFTIHSHAKILALHVSQKTLQSRFTEQFFSGLSGHENTLDPLPSPLLLNVTAEELYLILFYFILLVMTFRVNDMK